MLSLTSNQRRIGPKEKHNIDFCSYTMLRFLAKKNVASFLSSDLQQCKAIIEISIAMEKVFRKKKNHYVFVAFVAFYGFVALLIPHP